jgi:hypothetical protein
MKASIHPFYAGNEPVQRYAVFYGDALIATTNDKTSAEKCRDDAPRLYARLNGRK